MNHGIFIDLDVMGQFHETDDEFDFAPRSLHALARLSAKDLTSVVMVRDALYKAQFTQGTLADDPVFSKFQAAVSARGGMLDTLYPYPSVEVTPDDPCESELAGQAQDVFQQIATTHDLDLSASFVVCDRLDGIATYGMCQEMHCIYLLSDFGVDHFIESFRERPFQFQVAYDLMDAVFMIEKQAYHPEVNQALYCSNPTIKKIQEIDSMIASHFVAKSMY